MEPVVAGTQKDCQRGLHYPDYNMNFYQNPIMEYSAMQSEVRQCKLSYTPLGFLSTRVELLTQNANSFYKFT